MTLEEIIIGCKQNDPLAQEQLYVLFSKKMFGLCLKYASNFADAQDNLQDGFIQIFKTIKQLKNINSFKGWAKRVMINNALKQFKKNKHLEIVLDIADYQDDEIDDCENFSQEFLLQLIQELPERYRLVFNLYVMDEYSHIEISEMLGVSVGTSKSNLSRARQILREKIGVATKKLQTL